MAGIGDGSRFPFEVTPASLNSLMLKFPLLILLAFAPACVASYPVVFQSGANFDQALTSQITLGETTAMDIEKLFGAPAETAASVTGLSVWSYSRASFGRQGMPWHREWDNRVKMLQIHMRDGVVVDYLAHRM